MNIEAQNTLTEYKKRLVESIKSIPVWGSQSVSVNGSSVLIDEFISKQIVIDLINNLD